MKKFIPVLLGLALTLGAVSMYAGPQEKTKSTAKSTKKAPKAKKATK